MVSLDFATGFIVLFLELQSLYLFRQSNFL